MTAWVFRIDGMVGAQRVELESFRRVLRERPLRHPLRDQVVEARHELPWGVGRRAARGRRAEGRVHHGVLYGGYTTNVPLADLTGGKAWVVTEHEGEPLPREHGGPARLLAPHLYFWKSAKWVAGLRVLDHDEPGFWEQNGYHTAAATPGRRSAGWND